MFKVIFSDENRIMDTIKAIIIDERKHLSFPLKFIPKYQTDCDCAGLIPYTMATLSNYSLIR